MIRPTRHLPILACVALLGCKAGAEGAIPTVELATAPFEVRLTVSGQLEAVDSVGIAAPELGRSTKVTMIVDDGARVQKGDLLVQFDRTDLLTELEDEESKHEVATTRIAQREAQSAVKLAELANSVERARIDLERARMRVTESEAIPRVERQGARLDVQEAELALERAEKALEAARLEGEAELELLRIEARRAKARVRQARERLAQVEINAPTDGLVIKHEIWNGGRRAPVQAGDTVWRGTQLLELPDLSSMQVLAWVHEVDAGRVAVGQPVTVIMDAFPDPPIEGEVEKLADMAVERPGSGKARFLRVTIGLPAVSDVMKPGMTVRSEVLVERIEEALAIPLEAISWATTGPRVFRQGESGWTTVPVELGSTNDTHAVVTEGLTPGDILALADPSRWASGEPEPVVAATPRP